MICKFKGAVLIVNLTDANDNNEGRCVRYWPENGSHVYGSYEVKYFEIFSWTFFFIFYFSFFF